MAVLLQRISFVDVTFSEMLGTLSITRLDSALHTGEDWLASPRTTTDQLPSALTIRAEHFD